MIVPRAYNAHSSAGGSREQRCKSKKSRAKSQRRHVTLHGRTSQQVRYCAKIPAHRICILRSASGVDGHLEHRRRLRQEAPQSGSAARYDTMQGKAMPCTVGTMRPHVSRDQSNATPHHKHTCSTRMLDCFTLTEGGSFTLPKDRHYQGDKD